MTRSGAGCARPMRWDARRTSRGSRHGSRDGERCHQGGRLRELGGGTERVSRHPSEMPARPASDESRHGRDGDHHRAERGADGDDTDRHRQGGRGEASTEADPCESQPTPFRPPHGRRSWCRAGRPRRRGRARRPRSRRGGTAVRRRAHPAPRSAARDRARALRLRTHRTVDRASPSRIPPESAAPTPSAVSASPSRCIAPVRATPAAHPRTAAGTVEARGRAQATPRSPLRRRPRPAGRRPCRRASSPSPTLVRRPTGTAVRNVTAATAGAHASRTTDPRRFEGRHLGQDRHRGPDERERERRSRPLAEPQPQIEQRDEAQSLEDERMTRLG